MIVIQNLKKKFNNQWVLDGIDLQIKRGEKVAVLGSSGSGKSTLLRCIGGLEEAESGTIQINGTRVGMVFQNFQLFPHMNVLKNLIYAPTRVQKVPLEQATEKAKALLKQVGLESKASVFPHTLSGGEKQRVAIARTLMMDPDLILFDEPTSALDPGMVNEVLKVIQNLAFTGITFLIVTHEMGFVRRASDRVLFLCEGKIIEDRKTADFFSLQSASSHKSTPGRQSNLGASLEKIPEHFFV
jgi:polar amino acid transport system ATP-binding protein